MTTYKKGTSKLSKLVIRTDELGDPIQVFLENWELGQGQLTIVVCGECWSHCWGCMGEQHTLESFLLSCDNHYIAKKLATQAALSEPDYDQFIINAKQYVIEERREFQITKGEARESFNAINEIEPYEQWFFDSSNHDTLCTAAGNEWWYGIPDKESSLASYLYKIIDALKYALSDIKAKETV